MMTPRISRRISTSDKFKKDESEVRQTNLELKIAGQGSKTVLDQNVFSLAFRNAFDVIFRNILILHRRFATKKIVCYKSSLTIMKIYLLKPSKIQNYFTYVTLLLLCGILVDCYGTLRGKRLQPSRTSSFWTTVGIETVFESSIDLC